jgi:ribosomal protein S10
VEKIQFIIYGTDKDQIRTIAGDIHSYIEQKGIEHTGPHTPPPFEATWEPDENIELLGQPALDEEVKILAGEKVFSRRFTFHQYSSNEVLNDLVKRDYPDDIFIRVDTSQPGVGGSNFPNAPFSYDPESDYTSEM